MFDAVLWTVAFVLPWLGWYLGERVRYTASRRSRILREHGRLLATGIPRGTPIPEARRTYNLIRRNHKLRQTWRKVEVVK